jgi:hypothetical protein
MSTQLNLKEVERKAYRSTYQDGLLDIEYGLIVVSMAIFLYRPADGYSPMNIILSVVIISLANLLYFAGKKYVTLPRLGQVRFGPVRRQKAKTLSIVLGVFILFQVGLVALTAYGWANPEVSAALSSYFSGSQSLILVAAIGSTIVGTSMIVIAYFTDFPRGYYIAILMALAVFLMIYINQPIYPIIIGVLIIIPGLMLFVRFLKTYPLHGEDTPDA